MGDTLKLQTVGKSHTRAIDLYLRRKCKPDHPREIINASEKIAEQTDPQRAESIAQEAMGKVLRKLKKSLE